MVRSWAYREQRLDARQGIVAAILMNVNRRKGTKTFSPQDFVPNYLGERRQPLPKDGEELWDRINTSMIALGGK